MTKKQRFLLPVRRNMTAAPAETVYVPPAMNRNSVTVAGPVKISPGKKNPALLMREPTATEHTHTKRGCEITASTEKEDFSFKMNERSSFMLKLTCDENFNYKL